MEKGKYGSIYLKINKKKTWVVDQETLESLSVTGRMERRGFLKHLGRRATYPCRSRPTPGLASK
jgi:hypothetical protein